ncbi:MAG TPA: FHA domain-containing protein [Alphaproteobacteria bacterium]|jgi:hypothetical protein
MDSGRLYRVGRDQTNDIVIEHGSVSRHHCELRLQDDGAVLIIDLNSMNGTAVRQNGAWENVDKATVERDERILLGEIVTTVAALLMRAPKAADRPAAERPAAAAQAPALAPRKIPKPTTPANPEASGLVGRLMKSDWARLHRRGGGRKAERDEPSICLPAFVSAVEAEGDPARLLRSPPALALSRGQAPAPAPSLFGTAPDSNSLSARAPKLAEGAGIVPPAPADAIAVAPRLAPSLRAGPIPRRAAGLSDSIVSSPPPPAPHARRRLLPRWLPRPSSPEFAKWAVVGSALLLTSGGALAAYLRYAPDTEMRAAAAQAEPAQRAVRGKAERAPAEAPPAARPLARPSEARKAEPAKPQTPKATEGTSARARPWQRSIEGTPESTVAAAAPSGDGLCLAGTTSLGGGYEAWVVKTDAEGNARWQRRPGGPKRDGALAVTAAGDGGCVAAGYDSDEARLWIFKLDGKGVLAWTRTVPVGHTGRAVAIVRTRDGGFAVAAYARPGADRPDRAFVLRLAKNGEIVWSKFAGKGESRAADLRETRDGGFVVAGVAREGAESRLALWAARLDRKGHTLWEEHFDGPGVPEGVRVEVARGRDFILAATMTGAKPAPGDAIAASILRLVRVSAEGDAIWDRRHAGAPRHVAGLVLVKGGILVAGDAGGETSELWLAHYDVQGRAVRESRLAAAKGDRAAALADLGEGRLVLVGTAALESAAQRGAGLIFIDRNRQLAAGR